MELKPLHQYQIELKKQLEEVLAVGNGARAMVALPTGAGKTRLLVDTILLWPEIANGDSCIMWVAQHEEHCANKQSNVSVKYGLRGVSQGIDY